MHVTAFVTRASPFHGANYITFCSAILVPLFWLSHRLSVCYVCTRSSSRRVINEIRMKPVKVKPTTRTFKRPRFKVLFNQINKRLRVRCFCEKSLFAKQLFLNQLFVYLSTASPAASRVSQNSEKNSHSQSHSRPCFYFWS